MPERVLEDRYRLDAELGQGGMGALYRAHDILLDRDVAIKLLSGQNLGSQGRARLLHEAQAAAKLDHPNIVSIYDVGEADNQPFIVMQLIPGETLHDLRPTDLQEIIEIMLQVCAALEHAHAHGIIHRDLKPENVLVTPDGVAKLTDFGLARSKVSRLSGEGVLIGTVFYMAPEQALGQAVDGRSDLYALGVMLYELVTGRLPFTAEDPVSVISQHLYAPVVPPSTYRQEIPSSLDRLILSLLNKRPADRPRDAGETANLLLASLEPAILEAEPAAVMTAGGSVLGRIARGRLVGRQAELTQLHEIWAYTQQGNGHLALISGEPGVGKTRLANEMIVFAQLNRAAVLKAGCFELEATTPYLPFAEALRDWSTRQNVVALRQQLGSTAYELARLAPEIENRIGPLTPNPPLPANEERLRMFDNLARFMQKLAGENGLLVYIDDLHWADSGTIALLHYLLRRLRNERFMLLAAYREVELDRSRPLSNALVEWNRERLATRLAIGRLDLAGCRAMLAGLFGLETISDEFTELIYHETEGNPFFIEEVVKSLIEQDQIYREGDKWQRKEIGDLTVPQSVREAIGRRLNRLSKTCLETLNIAAVLGKTFEFNELAAVSDISEEELLDAMDEASMAQLIANNSDESFAFTHDKIREVLYAGLNPIRRRRQHQRIGDGLIHLYAPQLDEHASELAYHFVESGDLEKGLFYSRVAAWQAQKIFANDEALFYFQRAAECAEGLNLVEDQASIHEAIGDIYYRATPFEQAAEHYQRALELSSSKEKRVELSAKIGATYALTGDERGEAYLKATLDELDPNTQVEAKARALAMLGRYHHYHGQGEQAIDYLERARLLAEPLGDPDLLTDIYAYLSGAHQWWGKTEVSNAWARKTLEFGEQNNYPHAIALGYEFLAENAFGVGKWQESIEFAAKDRQIGEKIGSQDRIGWAEMSTAFALHGIGNLEEAMNAAIRCLTQAQISGDSRLELIIRSRRAQIYSDLDDETAMQAELQYIFEQAYKVNQFQVYEWAYQALCYIQLARHSWSELLQAVEKYEELTRRQHPHWYVLAYIGLGQVENLAPFPKEILELPPEDQHLLNQAHRWRWRGKYQQLLGEYVQAEDALTRSLIIFEELDSRLEHARGLVWRARLYLEMGRRADSLADLSQAMEIFEQCGAKMDRKQAQNLLLDFGDAGGM